MRKKHVCFLTIALIIALVSVISTIIFRQNINITKRSIIVIYLLIFHLLYGLVAFCLRHKGNFLRFRIILLKHFVFYLFEKNEEYTFTKEYKHVFFDMLTIYYIVVPLYIPCILFASSNAAIIASLIIFLFPQMLFFSKEIHDFYVDVKKHKINNRQEEQALVEQKRLEEMGKWKK